jgi:hypothetical protein
MPPVHYRAGLRPLRSVPVTAPTEEVPYVLAGTLQRLRNAPPL